MLLLCHNFIISCHRSCHCLWSLYSLHSRLDRGGWLVRFCWWRSAPFTLEKIRDAWCVWRCSCAWFAIICLRISFQRIAITKLSRVPFVLLLSRCHLRVMLCHIFVMSLTVCVVSLLNAKIFDSILFFLVIDPFAIRRLRCFRMFSLYWVLAAANLLVQNFNVLSSLSQSLHWMRLLNKGLHKVIIACKLCLAFENLWAHIMLNFVLKFFLFLLMIPFISAILFGRQLVLRRCRTLFSCR